MCTFAIGIEKQVLRKLKNEFSIFKSPKQRLNRWRSCFRSAIRKQVFIAIDGHRLLSRLDIVQVNLTLCSLLHQFAKSQL